jgi:transcriptional regulator with XRE-family HTH domain
MAGLKVKEIQALSGVSAVTITKIENGRTKPIPVVVKSLERVFADLGITFFVDGETEGVKIGVKNKTGT